MTHAPLFDGHCTAFHCELDSEADPAQPTPHVPPVGWPAPAAGSAPLLDSRGDPSLTVTRVGPGRQVPREMDWRRDHDVVGTNVGGRTSRAAKLDWVAPSDVFGPSAYERNRFTPPKLNSAASDDLVRPIRPGCGRQSAETQVIFLSAEQAAAQRVLSADRNKKGAPSHGAPVTVSGRRRGVGLTVFVGSFPGERGRQVTRSTPSPGDRPSYESRCRHLATGRIGSRERTCVQGGPPAAGSESLARARLRPIAEGLVRESFAGPLCLLRSRHLPPTPSWATGRYIDHRNQKLPRWFNAISRDDNEHCPLQGVRPAKPFVVQVVVSEAAMKKTLVLHSSRNGTDDFQGNRRPASKLLEAANRGARRAYLDWPNFSDRTQKVYESTHGSPPADGGDSRLSLSNDVVRPETSMSQKYHFVLAPLSSSRHKHNYRDSTLFGDAVLPPLSEAGKCRGRRAVHEVSFGSPQIGSQLSTRDSGLPFNRQRKFGWNATLGTFEPIPDL